MLAFQARRLLAKPRTFLYIAAIIALLYILSSKTASRRYRAIVPATAPAVVSNLDPSPNQSPDGQGGEIGGIGGIERLEGGFLQNFLGLRPADLAKQREERVRQESEWRKEFSELNKAAKKRPGAGALYGNTFKTLDDQSAKRSATHAAALEETTDTLAFTDEEVYTYNPYPAYNQRSWLPGSSGRKAQYVPCTGPDDEEVKDMRVFKGTPRDFPKPQIGGYEVLGLDSNICFERETLLGQYGYTSGTNKPTKDWDSVDWGSLQNTCVQKNEARYDLEGSPNAYLRSAYPEEDLDKMEGPQTNPKFNYKRQMKSASDTMDMDSTNQVLSRRYLLEHASAKFRKGNNKMTQTKTKTKTMTGSKMEARTALLLRSYSGKSYEENDKQVIRAMVTELSLRTGGQYQVFLFVQVKDNNLNIWDDEETYQRVLHESVPREFVNMTILWNDQSVNDMYPKLPMPTKSVHNSQWFSVQKFSLDYPEFDFVWNWEIDARLIGSHYEFLEKIATFSRKQPRRGLWERSGRYYIPSVHGDYDTQFRQYVEQRSTNGTVWGAPKLPFISPVGPKPPNLLPEQDDYQWGIDEEADVIMAAPMFEPIKSEWIGWTDVWGYGDENHHAMDMPRRATIITHSRVSKRLLDVMHIENLRGNHVSSELTPQTVALLHGLKGVHAPMPMWFDRPFSGTEIEKWLDGGPHGESGSTNSPYGWGREGRFGGFTWYFRADPPQRLYLNWMGWEDTGIGGPEWESIHGRTCLPQMMIHPIKQIVETKPGHSSISKIPGLSDD